MIWLTWRQFRGQAIAGGALLAAVAIALAITGRYVAHDYASAGLGTCTTTCPGLASAFLTSVKASGLGVIFFATIAIMYLVPALMGVFWGAPLVARELETGTFRIAWNQSVTRARWTAVKLAAVGLCAMAAAGLLSLVAGWWDSPIETALRYSSQDIKLNRVSPLMFGASGITPLAYAAFAFVLGVTLGVVLRRTVPAMALTLAVFAAVQVLMPLYVRPHLMTSSQVSRPFNPNFSELMVSGPKAQMTLLDDARIPGAWVLSNTTVTPAGKVFIGPATQACLGTNSQACTNWIASKHLRQVITYQPASHFWPLQWRETGLYLVLAAGLGYACAWQVRRRRL